jgi:hypothetical protein
VLLGHNAKSFDCPILLNATTACGMERELQRAVGGFVDTLTLLKKLHPRLGSHALGSLYQHLLHKERNAERGDHIHSRESQGRRGEGGDSSSEHSAHASDGASRRLHEHSLPKDQRERAESDKESQSKLGNSTTSTDAVPTSQQAQSGGDGRDSDKRGDGNRTVNENHNDNCSASNDASQATLKGAAAAASTSDKATPASSSQLHDASEDVRVLHYVIMRSAAMTSSGQLNRHLLSQHSFSVAYVLQSLAYGREKARFMSSWQPLVEEGVVSSYIAEKAAGSGLDFGVVREAYEEGGREGALRVLTQPVRKEEGGGQWERVTKKKSILDNILTYLRDGGSNL